MLAYDGVAMVDDSTTVLLDDDGWIAPRPAGQHRPLRLRLGPRLQARRCARSTRSPDRRRCFPATPSATGGAATTPTPPTSTTRWWTASAPRTCRSPSPSSTWTGTWSTSTPSTAAAGPATPGTATSSRPAGVPRRAARARAWRSRSTCTPPRACRPSRRRTRGSRSALGIDPAAGEPVAFDITDPVPRAYFEQLHHPLEDEGVDFWWMDWQQGGGTPDRRASTRCGCSTTSLPGLRPGGQPAADVLALGRPGQPPLPGRFSGDTR